MTEIFLGTVALEPNRWATIDPSWCATIEISPWLDQIADAGFDGIELWEKHATEASEAEIERLTDHRLPISVFNSYTSFDLAEPDFRNLTASWVERCASSGVKYNVGNDPEQESAYVERLIDWSVQMPEGVRLLNECHFGISLCEDPVVTARILDAAGAPERFGAIIHSSDTDDLLRARFDRHGDRVSHVHVNHLTDGLAPKLADIADVFEAKVDLILGLGFSGTWTIEFAEGLLTENDTPEHTLASAIDDLRVLRGLLPE